MSDFAKDYVEVAERITAFYERYPDGRLQSEMVSLTDTLVVMKGYAYRTPDDPLPGCDYSTLTIPGKTPYTRDAEVENASTSAIGRAIVMVGIPSKKVASADEVRAKGGTTAPAPQPQQQRAAPASQKSAPGTGHSDWAEGDVHDANHRPLKRNAKGLFCPTKLDDGSWCPWRPQPGVAGAKPHPVTDDPAQPTDEELASLASLPF